MPRQSKNNFTISGDMITIAHPDWDFIATATIRDDYAEEFQSVTWSKKGEYLYNEKLGGYLHIYIMKKWYGEETYEQMSADGYVVDHMDNNGMTSWTYGIFMDNIAISDLNYDGIQEIIVPSDLSFVSVFEPDGSPFKANSEVFGDRFWGQIALFEDYAAEIRGDNGGWGSSETYGKLREELYKGEFGHSKAVVADVDGNGSKEVIVPTIMCNRKYAPAYPPTEYMTVAILNADRTRYKNEALGFNWEVFPMDLGKPLVDNYQILCSHVYQRPTVCDIDGDGLKEILFNSYNGKVHCFSLNKKEPYAWPFSLTKRTSPEFEYASPVECKDINGDGKQEVIFSSFYDPTMGYGTIKGSLYVLNYEGRVIHKIPFPDTKESGMYTNGSMAAPVVDDIDGDGAYEVVVNSLHGAICVFDL